MRLFLGVSTLSLFVLTNPAVAESGFSIGGSITQTEIEDSEAGAEFDANDIGFKLFGNYRFTDVLGVEVAYVDIGEPTTTIFGSAASVEATGWTAYLVGNLGVSSRVDLFGKAGLLAYDAETRVDSTVTSNESGTDLALGIGGRVRFNDVFGVRCEFEWFDIDATDSAWAISIGLEIAF